MNGEAIGFPAHDDVRAILVAALAATFLAIAPAWAEVEEDSCDSALAWGVIDTSGGAAKPELAIAAGREGTAVEFRFQRVAGLPVALVKPSLLAGLVALEFDAWVEKKTQLLVVTEEFDGARFQAVLELDPGVWRRVRLIPADFAVAEDSPVKKDRMDPETLGFGWGMIDLTGVLGEPGPNAIRVDSVRLERRELPDAGIPEVVDGGTVEVTRPSRCDHDVVVRGGGRIKVVAPTFVLAGNVTIEEGAFEVERALLHLPASFVHERKVEAHGESVIALRDVRVLAPFLTEWRAGKGALLEVDGYESLANPSSTSVDDGGTARIQHAERIGEFMIFPGATLSVEDSEGLLVWLTFAENGQGTLRLPDPAAIEDWSLDPAFLMDVRIRKCEAMSWGLISAPGSDLVVEGTKLGPVAITLWGKASVEGLKNGDPAGGDRLVFSDRKLTFHGTTVDVWNLYAAPGSDVTISDCTIGECWSFGDASLLLERSTVDGKGGYVLASDTSTYRIADSRLECDVVARGTATLVLERCEISKDLTASEKATVRTADSRVAGRTQVLGEARIEPASGDGGEK